MILTVDSLKDYLAIPAGDLSEDDRLAVIAAGTEACIERFCRRRFSLDSYVSFLDGDGLNNILWLPNRPVVSVTSVGIAVAAIGDPSDQDVYESTSDWILDTDRDALINLLSPWPEGLKNIRVDYTAGYETPPDDVVLAAMQIAAELRLSADKGVPVVSERLGDYAYQLLRNGTAESLASAQKILTHFRAPAI